MGNLKKIKNHVFTDPKSGSKILLDIYFKESDAPKDVIVFSHGFKGFKDWGYFDLMADFFANQGYVFIKFNFSLNGTSPEKPDEFVDLESFAKNTFSQELADLDAVINWVTENNEFLPKENIQKVFLLGHSRGGFIATLEAFDSNKVHGLVTLAAVADFKNRYTEQQIELWKADGVMYIENARTKQQMPLNFTLYEDLIENHDRLNINEKASKLSKPWLIVHGSADTSVDVSHAYKFKELNNNAELMIIDGADHVFGGAHPWEKQQLPDDMQKACNEILIFLKKV
ncbi:alpha/beta hydrolase [Cytophagaceae bacterium ABcell3]|nr:alpha/beta hydrolase [Cytophagaceae bacterium ABcell3]